jgi:hypothetical protein
MVEGPLLETGKDKIVRWLKVATKFFADKEVAPTYGHLF